MRTTCLGLLLLAAGCNHTAPEPLLLVAPWEASPAADLDDQPAGFLLGSPLGFTARGGAAGVPIAHAVQVVAAGFTAGSPPTTTVDFTRFPDDCLGGTPAATAPILAMSLGLDVLNVEPLTLRGAAAAAAGGADLLDGLPLASDLPVALLDIASHGGAAWMAIQFVVNSDELGVSDAELAPDIADAKLAGELDATVFSYLVPGSSATMLPVEDQSVRAIAPDKLGLGMGDRIDGLSMHMALYTTDLGAFPNVFTTRALPAKPAIYFTLRPAFVASPASAELAAHWGLQALDSATIYVTNWGGASWGMPLVYAKASALGIASSHKPGAGAVIDGLAIDAVKPGANGAAAAGDRVLFSLADHKGHAVPAELQMQFAVLGLGEPLPPLRVVVPDGRGRYRSLGRQLGGGRGIGDFCSKDPSWRGARGYEDPRNVIVLDDLFVARRLPPDEAYRLPPAIVNLHAAAPGVSRPWRYVPPLRWWPDHGRVRAEDILRPGWGNTRDLPELGLAVASYRQLQSGTPVLFTCMSWPRPAASSGRAIVRWGRMRNFLDDPLQPASIRWLGYQRFAYGGGPLAHRIALPGDGLSSTAPPAGAQPLEQRTRAMVAQWLLEAGGRSYVSPISCLRY